MIVQFHILHNIHRTKSFHYFNEMRKPPKSFNKGFHNTFNQNDFLYCYITSNYLNSIHAHEIPFFLVGNHNVTTFKPGCMSSRLQPALQAERGRRKAQHALFLLVQKLGMPSLLSSVAFCSNKG
jgi:hypothetical protein